MLTENMLKALPHLIEQLAEGRSMRSIVLEDRDKNPYLPSYGTLISWRSDNPDFEERIDKAREFGMEKLIDEIIAIADNAPLDKLELSKARVMIDARERAARLLAPKRFKNSVDVTSNGKELPPALVMNRDERIQMLIMDAIERKRNAEALKQVMDE
jgi:hypothetical protein